MVFLTGSLNMKNTLTKTMKHAPVAGTLGIWQRDSRPLGSVGTKL